MTKDTKEALDKSWEEYRIRSLAKSTGEDERSKMFGICQRCNKAPIRNYGYNYCPECMNKWYIENSLSPVEWVKNADGILVGKT